MWIENGGATSCLHPSRWSRCEGAPRPSLETEGDSHVLSVT